ncbi:prepilin peptidase [Parasphingopyxis sp. CP4]|nr:prepilin peptidase [Parasphingopyxis sp. CP4]
MIWRIAAGAVLGAIIGSFLATLAIRWPQGESASAGRSRCDSCDQTLGVFDLIPLIGYFANRGRCRNCRAVIDQIHPLTEIAAALVGALAISIQPNLHGVAGAILGWALLLLAVLDIRHFWLPDRVTLPLILVGLGAAWMFGAPSPLSAAIGAAAGYLLLTIINLLYRALRGRNGLGGGDSKLMAAIGAWLGWEMLPLILLLASTSGLIAVLIFAVRGRAISGADRLPFGAFLALVAWPLWLARDALGGILPGL